MTGNLNTGVGASALSSNAAGFFNTATGAFALQLNTTGDENTADGEGALNKNGTGFGNTATGSLALSNNTTGAFNTAAGRLALFDNDSGDGNTAIGGNALLNTTGSGNIGIGLDACVNTTTGSVNICVGSPGVAGESSTIRLGTVGIQTATFIAGISGTTSPGGVGVFINGNGQLGTATSSRRVKEGIREIGEESAGLMRLRPVAFRYKPQIDPVGLAQYGLIAEEVADVYPDLVVYDRDGQPETVRYHLINALLLNEVQKQHNTIEQQKDEIEELKARLGRLEDRSSN
jgi:Chaperone of endosialidase